MTEQEIEAVGLAIKPYLRDNATYVEIGTAAFNACAALKRIESARSAKLYELKHNVWHVGPKFITSWPIYDGDRHIGSFFEPDGENNARLVAAWSGKKQLENSDATP